MEHERVCPFWVGYFLICPIRKWFQNPKKLLSGYIRPGMKALDIGCAMGFFSLPLSKMVGPDGKVICLDVQERMIQTLRKRANKAGLLDRIETRICKSDSLGLEDLNEEIDFALASAVVHEFPDTEAFFSEIYHTLKKSGKLLIIEPKAHVSIADFKNTIIKAEKSGFNVIEKPHVRGSHSALLVKK